MATIKDIAKHSGLGLATVSRYINGGNVREHNKIAIEAAISEMGFSVNELARGLRTKKSRTIGVVIPELSDLFMTTILSHTEDILRNNGYSMIFVDCRSDEERERQAIHFVLSKKVDGIITMPIDQEGRHLLPAIKENIPIVLIDRVIDGLGESVHAVLIDNVAASEEATQLLIDAGHRDIGIIVGQEHVYTSRQRLRGYVQALNKHNIAVNKSYIQFSDYTAPGGYACAMHLLTHSMPTALFTTNYNTTLGAIMAINDMKLSIPNDIAVIGFDKMQIATVLRPKLTLVVQPLEKIAANAAHIMLQALENKLKEAVVKTLSTEIQYGESI